MRGFSTPTQWNSAEFGSRIWQNLADITVGTGPYMPPPLII